MSSFLSCNLGSTLCLIVRNKRVLRKSTCIMRLRGEKDEQAASRLLNRRAPFSLRIKLAAKLPWNLVSNRGGKDGDYYAGHDVPCHT